jgi:hypothetical protein
MTTNDKIDIAIYVVMAFVLFKFYDLVWEVIKIYYGKIKVWISPSRHLKFGLLTAIMNLKKYNRYRKLLTTGMDAWTAIKTAELPCRQYP